MGTGSPPFTVSGTPARDPGRRHRAGAGGVLPGGGAPLGVGDTWWAHDPPPLRVTQSVAGSRSWSRRQPGPRPAGCPGAGPPPGQPAGGGTPRPGAAAAARGGEAQVADLVQSLDLGRARRPLGHQRPDRRHGPSRDLAAPPDRPDSAARAASTASSRSDLPDRRRACRLGRPAPATATPDARKNRASPAPEEPVPSTPARATGPNPDSQPSSSR